MQELACTSKSKYSKYPKWGNCIPAEMVVLFSARRSRLSLAVDETTRKKLFPDWQNGDIAGKA